MQCLWALELILDTTGHSLCNTSAGKFMVVEGQVMESMRWQQQPLPCEVCDVSTAVFDGADGLMITSATSIGTNPVQVQMLPTLLSIYPLFWLQPALLISDDCSEL